MEIYIPDRSETSSTKKEISKALDEDLISKLVEFLQSSQCKHIIGGIIKSILEELNNYNPNHPISVFKKWEDIGTTTMQTFGGDTSLWTSFCADLAKNINKLTSLCQPITCDPPLQEKIDMLEAELEKLKNLNEKESNIRKQAMIERATRDGLLLKLYKNRDTTVGRNWRVVQEMQELDAAFQETMKALREVVFQREEASDRCDQLRQSFLQFDRDELQREINACATCWHICGSLKSLVEKLKLKRSFKKLSL